QAGLLGTRAGALVLGGLLSDANLAIALFALTSTLCWFAFMLWNLTIGGVRPRRGIRIFLREAAAYLHLLVPAVLGKAVSLMTSHEIFAIIGAVISALLVFKVAYRQFK